MEVDTFDMLWKIKSSHLVCESRARQSLIILINYEEDMEVVSSIPLTIVQNEVNWHSIKWVTSICGANDGPHSIWLAYVT